MTKILPTSYTAKKRKKTLVTKTKKKTMSTCHNRHLPNVYENVKLIRMPRQKTERRTHGNIFKFFSYFFAPKMGKAWKVDYICLVKNIPKGLLILDEFAGYLGLYAKVCVIRRKSSTLARISY